MKNNIVLDKESPVIIAVDGEAASGKGTICKRLAKEFNLYYCQTSIFYRKLARIIIDNKISEISEIIQLAASLAKQDLDSNLDNIYSEEVSRKASEIASISEIREALNIPQRELLSLHKRIIMEGRDIGTVIAPNAQVKLYIKADIDIRAKRRYDERVTKEPGLKIEQVKADLIKRDERDKGRKDAPLAIAKDAIILDSSEVKADEFYNNTIKAISSYLSLN